MDRDTYMAGKYDPETIATMGWRLAQIARREGLPMADLETLTTRPSTFAAHRLMTAAIQEGAGRQQALGEALFVAYWSRGEDIGAREVLLAAAEAAGMEAGAAARVLDGDAFAAEVRAQETEAARLGIHAVPTFVFDGRFSVVGAQDPEVLVRTARRALRDSRSPYPTRCDAPAVTA